MLVAVALLVVTTVARGDRETGPGVWKKLGWETPVPLGVAIRGWTERMPAVNRMKTAEMLV